MNRSRLAFLTKLPLFLILLATTITFVGAQNNPPQNSGAQNAAPQQTGYAVKKPVFGGACKTCPWGATADFVKAALQPYGWDVQVCYNCSGGPRELRMVAGAQIPPPVQDVPGMPGLRALIPPPPNGPVDFGTINPHYLWWAYQGTHDFVKEGPRKYLRLIGTIQEPYYLIVAVKADSGITDLGAYLRDVKEKHLPAHILTDGYTGSPDGGGHWKDILAYYGMTKDDVVSAGGTITFQGNLEARKNFDVIIGGGNLENAPEWNNWYELTQKYDLKYLQLPDDLLAILVKNHDMERGVMPLGVLRGVDRPIPTVTYTGNAVYGRTDMPDDFAYTAAKAMDEQQQLLQWNPLHLSYNVHTVWKAFGVPLHPGAERYYREKGYMK